MAGGRSSTLAAINAIFGRWRVTSSKVTVASDPVEVARVPLEDQLDEWAVEFENEDDDGTPSRLDVVEWLGELAELERSESRDRPRQRPDYRPLGQALRGLALVAVSAEGNGQAASSIKE